MATVRPLYLNSTYGGYSQSADTDTVQAGLFAAAGLSGVAFQANGNLVSGLASPLSATDAATKGYVDGIAQGVSVVSSVQAMANGNMSLTGLQTVDGVALTAGARVLLTAQTNAVQNGIWIVASGAWARPTTQGDYVTGRQFAGLYTYVESGTNFAAEQWAATGSSTGKIDTDPSTWTQLTGAAEIVAGNGLAKSAVNGNTLSAVLASASGLQFTGGAIDTLLNSAGGLAKSASGLGVSLNTNNTLAVDSQGLRTLGLPSLFTVAGTSTASTVSAASLNTLTAGTGSAADALHTHTSVTGAKANQETLSNSSTALAAGDPVVWSSTASTVARADATVGNSYLAFGIATAAIPANGSGVIIRRGIATGVISQGTPGAPVYLNSGGGLTMTMQTASGTNSVRIGVCVNSTDVDVNVLPLVLRAA